MRVVVVLASSLVWSGRLRRDPRRPRDRPAQHGHGEPAKGQGRAQPRPSATMRGQDEPREFDLEGQDDEQQGEPPRADAPPRPAAQALLPGCRGARSWSGQRAAAPQGADLVGVEQPAVTLQAARVEVGRDDGGARGGEGAGRVGAQFVDGEVMGQRRSHSLSSPFSLVSRSYRVRATHDGRVRGRA